MKNNDEMPHNPFSLIADFDGDISSLFSQEVEPVLPVLPLRNMMLFPGVVAPVSVGRPASLKLVSQVAKSGGLMAVVCQKDAEVEFPGLDDLYNVGVVAKAVRVLELPDGTTTVILQSYGRVALNALTRTKPYLRAQVTPLDDVLPEDDDKEFEAVSEACKDLTLRWLKLNEQFRDEASFAIRNIKHPIFLTSFICTNMPFSIKEKAEILEEGDHKQRAFKLLSILNRECQYAHLKASIQNRTREELDQQQKEYFLQQQIKNIQDELGDNGNEDVKQLREKAEKLNMPEAIKKQMQKELAKLERINPQSPDYNVQVVYLQTVFSLPWGTKTDDDMRLETAEKVLNRDHYGMEKVKERVLEYLAVLPHRRNRKAPILCLYGPPGVGKTSLGKSVAEALGRKYVRISLGGVHDEAEIRGHRKTYVGAMPGRIIKSLIKAGTDNPVFILDEIDKVSQNNYHGDPQSALLEVLDPEQNSAFHDNYLDIDYDLSNVLFIATANSLNTIPGPLLDRMELIEVEGYLTEEKREIAKRHLVPKENSDIDFGKGKKVRFTPKALDFLIDNYTRESGVRQLEKQIGKIFRKVAYRAGKEADCALVENTLKPEHISELLGKPIYNRDKYQGNKYAGVVTGLAWTAVGGEILFIETSVSRSKAPRLTITGNLGEVMKESAALALEYVKAHAEHLNIDYRIFEQWSLHLHVPEGATPKDGPSAGITMATSIASALTQRKVKENIAMTGEITLRGRVLPVGGIKEKILAAKRAGITDIVMSVDNRKDIEEINEKYIEGLTFHFVENAQQVFDIALLNEKVDNAITLTVETENKEADKK
ncbi:MAG: endopeptidase La [Bacteroidaceae bacterium]|nr:endopeptidase La [Bacteroidaceae bacterium]